MPDMRLMIVVGARPNFVKVAPLMPALAAAGIDAGLVHTGQHYDAVMSDSFFESLEIPEPRWFLEVGSGTHAVQTGLAMMRLEELLIAQAEARTAPHALMVVGDVNSTLAGALAAAKLQVPVVHLEAGLRCFDMSLPEEVNRLVTDQLSCLLLTPTDDANKHLANEGVDPGRVRFVGNIMAESVVRHEPAARQLHASQRWGLEPGEFILATIHRPENTGVPARLAHIIAALATAPHPVLLPAHPRTRSALFELMDRSWPGAPNPHHRLKMVDPVGYLDMLSLQGDAAAVVTDSGGLQEEACMLGTPCVTVRRNTERQITVELGANRLVPAERDAILSGIDHALAAPRDWGRPQLWDDGVSGRVAEALVEWHGSQECGPAALPG